MEQQSTDLAIMDGEQPERAASALSLIMSEDSLTQLMRVADIMSSGKATMPKHLAGSPSDCFAVALQSMQWGMNPFAVAQKTHIVNGALGYEAQLVNAVIQSSKSIVGRFHYEYAGEGENMQCRVGAVIMGEQEITWGEWLVMRSVTTRNSPLWKTNPKQQLGYLQVKNWARAYCPGAILGVYTPDELADIKPEKVINPQRRQSGAEVAAAAAEVSDESDARMSMIADLECVARDEGLDAYAKLWATLTVPQRKIIGAAEHDRLKKLAGRVVEGEHLEVQQ